MRQGFADALTDKQRRSNLSLKVVDGAFDCIPSPSGSVDIVVAAQAFHWVGRDGSTAIKEIARVLKPGGKLCLIWNLENKETRWVAELREAYEKFEAGTPQSVGSSTFAAHAVNKLAERFLTGIDSDTGSRSLIRPFISPPSPILYFRTIINS